MFSEAIYVSRRTLLMDALESGLIFLPGNGESPMNYAGNPYPFRQDSTFLYYFGLDMPGLHALIDLEAGHSWLFGKDPDMHDTVWTGPQPRIRELADRIGADRSGEITELENTLREAFANGRSVHFLPPYRHQTMVWLGRLSGMDPERIGGHASEALIEAVVAQRSVKSPEEILEMDRAVDVTGIMHRAAMQATRPGITEARLAGMMEGIAVGEGGRLSYPAIVSVQGQILHNPYHHNTLQAGQLLLADCGAETPRRYAGDITRTWPVSQSFSSRQRDIYEIVLRSQEAALAALAPGLPYRDVHLLACKVLTEGLQDLGLMTGDVEASVAAGAHALFFPHGLGHLIGLDVHDMENLGEDKVGYDEHLSRSPQFGLRALRLGRDLQPGFTLSVEPGLYFIPELIRQWEQEGRHQNFIRYDKLEPYLNFGGIRIEDLALITADGYRLLGKPIPKAISELEELRAT